VYVRDVYLSSIWVLDSVW